MVAVRSAHINKAGEFDPEKWIASLGITSQKSCECLAETWAYCLQQTQGHPDASLLLWRGVEMVEILSTLSMDIDTLRAALLFPLADANVVSEDVLRESTLQIIAIFLFSCIAGMGSVLDEFQTHRPLIACTVIGLILGDLKTGIMLGGTLELIALGWMNVGAAQSPDSALASIISAILVIVGQQSIATGIAIALPVAAAGQVLTVFARTITVVFQHAADKAAEEARFRTLDILHVSALGVQALRVAIPALIVSLFVSADMVSNMLSAIPEFVTRGLQIAGGFIVVVGYAMVLRMMGVKYLMPFFFLGFLAGGYLDLSLLAFGGVGVIMALLYIQLNPQWRKAEPHPQTTTITALDQLDD